MQNGENLFIYLFIYLAREKQIELQMFERNAGWVWWKLANETFFALFPMLVNLITCLSLLIWDI